MARIFLDTNIYIVGAIDDQSDECRILEWLGFWQKSATGFKVIVSGELLNQVARVAKRIRNKDWSGELINLMMRNFDFIYATLEEKALAALQRQAIIPREDIGVYLTAQVGEADYFVSANRKLIRSLVQETQEFECLTPAEFVAKYLRFDGD